MNSHTFLMELGVKEAWPIEEKEISRNLVFNARERRMDFKLQAWHIFFPFQSQTRHFSMDPWNFIMSCSDSVEREKFLVKTLRVSVNSESEILHDVYNLEDILRQQVTLPSD